MPATDVLTIGLRFDRSEAKRLRALADRASLDPRHNEQLGLFNQAADAAETGEPLIVVCDNRAEVEMTADGFVKWGIRRPALEALPTL